MTAPTMNPARAVREARIRASLLMKAARAGDEAALDLLAGRIKRRRALDAAALELAGLPYRDLLARSRRASAADPARFFERPLAAYANHWFARYDEAATHRAACGGFLFPFRHQFVVMEDHVLRALSLDPDDPDWRAIGFDWVRPRDAAAFARLDALLCEAGFAARGTA